MSAPVRMASESAAAFDGRVRLHLRDLRCGTAPYVDRDAGAVYAEGVHAGLSIALAAIQRRERIIDHLARWESEIPARAARGAR